MLFELLSIVLPVFLVIGFGFAAVKSGAFPQEAVKYVTLYAQSFAVPLLLFNAVRSIDFANAFDARIYAAYYLPAIVVFGAGILFARKTGRGPQASVVLGFNAFFSNSVLLGLAISERAYGVESLQTNYLIIALHAPFGYTFGAVAMALARPDLRTLRGTLATTGHDLIRNPLIIGILAGLIVNFGHIPLPSFVVDGIDLQARAAIPAALFGLGGTLTRLHLRGSLGAIMGIGALRLFVHPALTLIMALFVLQIDHNIARNMVLTGAMATGVNGFVFAALYEREEETAASIVFATTMACIVTVPLWLAVLRFMTV